MDVKSKSSGRSNGNDFLADINRSKPTHRMTYGDGFRLGVGIITAQLLILLLIGGIAWALVVAFKLHS